MLPKVTTTWYKHFRIDSIKEGDLFHMRVYKPDKSIWYSHLAESEEIGLRRAYELIDSENYDGIIDQMNVTKLHKLQIGDIVTIRTSVNRKVLLGIVESIKEDIYYVSHLRQNKFYIKTDFDIPYQRDKLTIYPNREVWVRIKQDLDRQNDGLILQNWIENL